MFQGNIKGDMMTDMILNDILHDTAAELQAVEDDNNIYDEAVTMQHNPTLENIYQRLEQMEVKFYGEKVFFYKNFVLDFTLLNYCTCKKYRLHIYIFLLQNV
jgi:hypothetical protein